MPGDLHCHSCLSDGSMEVEEIVELAARLGHTFLSVTDHDTFDGVARAQAAAKKWNIQIVPGVELSCNDPENGRKVHILCYMPKEPMVLQPVMDGVLHDRYMAGVEMAQKVAKLYPVSSAHIRRYARTSASLYKQHIMRALMDLNYTDKMYGDLYKELFSTKTGSCIVSPKQPDVYKMLNLVKRAKGVAVLAHPSVYRSMDLLEKLACQGLIDGVEIHHPRNRQEDIPKMWEIARQYDLIVTAGSDFHGMHSSIPVHLGEVLSDDETLARIQACSQKKG